MTDVSVCEPPISQGPLKPEPRECRWCEELFLPEIRIGRKYGERYEYIATDTICTPKCRSEYMQDLVINPKMVRPPRGRGIRAVGGPDHPRFRPVGHRSPSQDGYVYVKVGADHPLSENKGWIAEHRLVMSGVLKRKLLPGENIHHINGIRDDNRAENLELWITPQPAGQRLSDKPHCPSCSCISPS